MTYAWGSGWLSSIDDAINWGMDDKEILDI